MLQCVCSVVDHSWRQSVVRTKKWRSEACGLDVTISASCDWSVAIFTTSLESQESYLTLRNLTSQITRDFFRLHSTFARLYNAAASPASRLRSADSLAIILQGEICARIVREKMVFESSSRALQVIHLIIPVRKITYKAVINIVKHCISSNST